MLYGADKRRQMARSILPSTRRQSAAKELAWIRRSHRHAVHRNLAALRGFAVRGPLAPAAGSHGDRLADVDDLADLGDATAWPHRRIAEAVLLRRFGDKIGPLVRWAVAVSADLPLEDRLPTIAAGLPFNLSGRHAMTHLELVPELVAPDRRQGSWWPGPPARRPDTAPSRQQIAAGVRAILDHGGHADLNRALKCRVVATRPRLLAGRHDVEAFVDQLVRRRRSGGETAETEYDVVVDVVERYVT